MFGAFVLAAFASFPAQASFSQEAKLLAPSPAMQTNFGGAVAISGTTAAVGAEAETIPGAIGRGAVHVYRANGSSWTHETTLHGPDTSTVALFGCSLAASADRIVVGAQQEHNPFNASISGVVYVFERSAGAWTLAATLAPSDGVDYDAFGYCLAIDADTIAIGARGADQPGYLSLGAVYVFVRQGSTWVQQAKLWPGDPAIGSSFAISVDLQGDRIVVGDPESDGPSAPAAGAAYLFTRTGTTWAQTAKLFASQPPPTFQSYLGWSVAVDGDRVFAGAPSDPANSGIGAVYVFQPSGSAWSQSARLVASDGQQPHQFGDALAVAGDVLAVGAYGYGQLGTYYTGAVYVFQRFSSGWTELGKVQANDPQPFSDLGRPLAYSDGRAITGALTADIPGTADVGAAYVFDLGEPVESYCVAGTNAAGCQPKLTSAGTPSASSSSGFALQVAGAQGQRSGVIFYGVSGRVWLPWSSTSSASGYLCVKPPVQRTAVQSTGGSSNLCDGSLQLDWNAFRANHPNALGQPFLAGAVVDAQGWMRDPPSAKGSMLSDALEFIVQP